MSKLHYFLFLFSVIFTKQVNAQQLYVSPEEFIDGNSGRVNVIGSLGDTTISFLENYAGFELIWYDSIMRKLGVSDLDFLEGGVEEFSFYTGTNAVFIFYQKKKRKQLELWAAKVIPADKDTIRPVLIDSMELSSIWDKARFALHNTQSKNRFAYSFSNYDNSKGQLDLSVNLLNENLNSIARIDEHMSNVAYYEALQIVVDETDGIHIVFGEPTGRGNRYQSVLMGSQAMNQSKMVYKKLDLKQYALANPQIVNNKSGNEITLGGIAYEKNAIKISALGRYVYKPLEQQWDGAHYTTITNEQGPNNNDLTNLQLQKIIPRADGGCVFVLEKTFEEVYQRNSGIGFISPGMSMASSSYSVFHIDELFIYNTNTIGNLEWATVVPKSQETSNANERLLSFGTLEYPLGTIFLFEDQSNKTDRFITAFLSNTGKLTLRQFQSANYSSIEEDGLLLRDAKQVSANAIVFPIIKHGTLSFAKIVF